MSQPPRSATILHSRNIAQNMVDSPDLKMSLIESVVEHTRWLFNKAKLQLYLLLVLPSGEQQSRNILFFRFGLPFVLKRSPRRVSTETHALQFLNASLPQHPFIPRLLDHFFIDNQSWTLMSKLHGTPLDDRITSPDNDMSPEQVQRLAYQVLDVIHQLWRIPQPLWMIENNTRVSVSASGHGLIHPAARAQEQWEDLTKPFPSTLSFYEGNICYHIDTVKAERPELIQAICEDEIVFVHLDLRMQNILVDDDFRLTGIVDWEESGWFPRHWQLHMLRRPGPTARGAWVRFWHFKEYKFEDVVERAYEACLSENMLLYPPI